MRKSPLITALILALTSAAPTLASQSVTEVCTSTHFSALAASDCRGAFVGNINGDASETTYLQQQWGDTFTYTGEIAYSPTNAATDVTLTFAKALSGQFVVGLKAADNYSYYLFKASSPVSSLTFDTTAGVAVNKNGIAQDLSHANLYVGAVPEPEAYAMLLAGLGLMASVARRRRQP